MKDEPRKATDDHLFDKVVVQLRDEVVPQVPMQLLECEPESEPLSSRQFPHKSMLTWGIGIAATILAMIGVANMLIPGGDTPVLSGGDQPVEIRDNIAAVLTKVHVQNLIALRPFEDLEREIAEMKSEVEQLKTEAVSLDAIRKIDDLMAKN